MDKVSVIIPVFKAEKMLVRCVDSVLQQSYENIEIILIDDGSPDNCGKICNAYQKKDTRIKVIHQENQGVSAARNAGLNIASGEYILFVDSDDAIHKDLVIENLKLLKAHKADMVIFNCIEIDGEKDFTRKYVTKNSFISREEALVTAPVLVTLKIYRKELFDNLRFPVNKIHEDNYIFPEIILRTNRIFCNIKPYYYYHINPNSIMHTLNFHHRYDAFLAFKNKLDIVEKFFPKIYGKTLNETFDMAFRTYNLNCKFAFLSSNELNNLKKFFTVYKSKYKYLSVTNKIFLLDYLHFGFVNSLKASYYKIKYKDN